MKQKNVRILTAVFLICMVLMSACGNPDPDDHQETVVTEPEEAEEADFSCSAVNEQGQAVYPFLRESDGIYYFAVPSSWELTQLQIRFSGHVAETRSGALNQEEKRVTGAFAKSGDRAVLELGDGTQITLEVLQSDLPSVQITLNGATLEDVHEDKDKKHKGNSVLITGADGSVDVQSADNVELKGRGNSTWRLYEKKGYQIKFDEETSVLGMEAAAKWVLLSNASDDSMVRSQVVYEAAKQLNMPFVPEFEYVDLWVNGEYRGTYMIGEKIELGSSRLDLENPLGTLFERDDAFYEDEEYWTHNDYLDAYFVLKDSAAEKDQLYRATLEDFSDAVDQLMIYLYSTPSRQVTLEDLSQRIDVDSFALYYLVNEYVQNRESLSTSFYWYMDGPDDVIHLGPIWDYDTCMGNDGTEATESYSHNSVLFQYLLAVPAFYERTQELYQSKKSVFDSMTESVDELGGQIEESVQMNYLRWDVLGTESAKQNGTDFSSSYSNALATLKGWLSSRVAEFTIPQTNVVASTVSDDYGTLHIRYTDDENYGSMRFVLWNQDSEDGSVMWYDGVKSSGEWMADADLGFFQEKGLYQIAVYAPGSEQPIATGVNYVGGVKKNPHTVEAVLSEDMKELTVTIEDPERRCSQIYMAIWSTNSNQKDLQVFYAEKDSGKKWTCTVDLSGFEAEGEYNVHVFGRTKAGDERINATTFIRYPIWEEGENPYLIETRLDEKTSTVTITMTEPTDDCSLVNFLVWSSSNGQSDLQVFAAEETAPGQWSYTVDMTLFEEDGQYNVHVFGEKPYGYIKLNTAVFYVDFSHG